VVFDRLMALDLELDDLLLNLLLFGLLSVLLVHVAELSLADELVTLPLFVLGGDLAVLVVVVNVDSRLVQVELGLLNLSLRGGLGV